MIETKTDALSSILTAEIPGLQWDVGDDLCDCTFQRIGFWTNPYIGQTLRVRLCCLWKELAKDYPYLIQEVPAFYNYNTHEYEPKPWDWNGEFDMPRAIWYRHLASKSGRPLAEIRQEYADKEPPKAVPKKRVAKARPTWRLR
jgi:hypothetical protein